MDPTVKFSPTKQFLPIPTPPTTVAAPVVSEVLCSVESTVKVVPGEFVISIVPVLVVAYVTVPAVNVPPTCKFLATPTPPANVAHPVVVEVASSVESTVKVVPVPLVTSKVPEEVELYDTEPPVIVPPTCKFPTIPTPPATCNAPVVVEVAAVV